MQSGAYVGETWEYDGRTWTQRTPATAPRPRIFHAMEFDGSAKRIVLFGGIDSQGVRRAETWIFDGTTWLERIMPAVPAPRSGPALAFDLTSQRLLLFGGEDSAGIRLADTWELRTAGWRPISTNTTPPARASHRTAFFAPLNAILMFGGETDNGASNDTWKFGFIQTLDSMDTCGAASPDADQDGRVACGATAAAPTTLPDPDCWGRCTPHCPPWTTAEDASTMTTLAWPASCALAFPAAPYCGDGQCATALETSSLCPQDCPAT